VNHRPRKRFGQNFLHDPNIINRIVSVIAPKPADNLIEIGPGQGALTFPVLSRCGQLRAIELDRDLAAWLREQSPAHGELELLSADALKTDFSPFGDAQRIIGNLPYNISSPLLFHLLRFKSQIRDMHFMLQKEVVQRMAAPAGSKTYGRLSVMIQAHCRVEKLLDVPPGAFNPPPAVDSAVVRMVPLAADDVPPHHPTHFADVVARAFAQRRKTLRNTLRGLLTAEDMEALGIDPGARAETLSVSDFAALSLRVNP
jgi:16S rRNA (adenine1518-N6/adenine1519-N6)-dimethyltransferase